MARVFWAFIAFNIYSLFLISAFQESTPYLFDLKSVSEMRTAGEIFNIKDWGWKDHYIWRIFSGAVVTAIAAFLAGAIARNKGGLVAAVANIPSIFVWATTFYITAFDKINVEAQMEFSLISLIAIPLTTWIAVQAGNAGAEVQTSTFTEDTVLGIRAFHWAWIVLPLYYYSMSIIYVVAKLLALDQITWGVSSIFMLLALPPIIAWATPLVMAYKILSGESLSDKPPIVKGLANAGILIGGAAVAMAIQIGCFWLIHKMAP